MPQEIPKHPHLLQSCSKKISQHPSLTVAFMTLNRYTKTMSIPKLKRLNTPCYFEEAFDAENNAKMLKDAALRRNVYRVLFLIGSCCIFITALSNRKGLCILALLLATASLIVIRKYETQLCFLRILKERKKQGEAPDHSGATDTE